MEGRENVEEMVMLGDARSKQTYGKRRKYHGRGKKEITAAVPVLEEVVTLPNEVSVDSDMEMVADISTISLSKVVDIDTENVEDAAAEITGYRLVDTTMLNCMFSCMACPERLQCETIYLEDINAKKKGLSRYLCIKCNKQL